MTGIETQIVDTWRIHNRITLFVIDHIPDAAFAATLSTRGGRDVARQLAHVNNVRVWRVQPFAKRMKLPIMEFAKGETPDRPALRRAFEQSGAAMERFVAHCVENGGAVSNFKRGVVPMVGYYIAHEAHHRGGILLTMKKSGFPLPEALRFGLWDWNKV